MLRLIKTSKVAKEVVILSNSSYDFNSFFLYYLDVNNRTAPIQVETVLTAPNETPIGIPTTVTAVGTAVIPLSMAIELAPADACSNLL